MDKAKAIGKQLLKYHFWLLCLLAMMLGLTGWMMGSRSLSDTYQQKKIEIVGKFTDLDTLRKSENPPNSDWKTGIDKLTDEERKKVAKAWDLVYSQQKDLLRWPADLGPPFLAFVESRGPNDEIPGDLLDRYQNTIRNEFPKLLAIVGAAADDARPKGPGNVGGPPAAPQSRVDWKSTGAIKGALEFATRPSSALVRLTQEDLWVYSALLHIIDNVNKDHYVARIREITALTIGRDAGQELAAGMAPGRIFRPAAEGTLAAAPAAPPVDPVGAIPGAEGADGAPKALDDKRYVDANDKPLAGGAAPDGQFKRMPVTMKLMIDQREINKLLVECANSPLPVEVRQLRINPSKQDRGKGNSQQQAQTGAAAAASSDFDVQIELHGIIYIYNRPDPTKLGGSAPNATADAGGAPATPPVAPGT